jgi:ATP-binding cassette, subfamily C, bacterial
VEMSRAAGMRQTELLKAISARLVEALSSIKPLKAMASENMLGRLLESDARSMNTARQKEVLSHESRYALYEPILAVLLAIGLYATLVLWKTELETVVLLALLFWRALTRVNGIQSEYQDLARVESAFWSLNAAIDRAASENELTTGGKKPVLNRAITFRNVSFSYGERKILKNISLRIPSGGFIALTGRSGAGKTTVADLVVGLIRPQEGDVYIDDLAMSDLDMRAWRLMIGYVPQETILFHDTIYANIALANLALTPEDVEASLRAAGAWEFVSKLHQGIHTTVGERGAKLSGGQRQRIAIARALVRKPALLVLDEVTSALDPGTEAEICSTLMRLKGTTTVFAISHQQALVDVADKVYFLDHRGSLMEQSKTEAHKQALAMEFS